MKMTVREALAYIVRGNGMTYTEQLNSKVRKFICSLPHSPAETRYDMNFGDRYTIKDYEEGWFAVVKVHEDNGKMIVEIIDGDNMDDNPNRVKSNAEALAILEEINDIKYATDFDEYWDMTDDHKYWRKMNQLNTDSRAKENSLKLKLS